MNNLLWQYANKVANDANQLAFLVGKVAAEEAGSDLIDEETGIDPSEQGSITTKAPWYAGLQDSLKGIHKNPYAQAAAGGGAAALVAALLTRKKKNRVRNTILAALGGSGAVVGGQALRREYLRRRYEKFWEQAKREYLRRRAEKDLGTD